VAHAAGVRPLRSCLATEEHSAVSPCTLWTSAHEVRRPVPSLLLLLDTLPGERDGGGRGGGERGREC